MFCNVISGDADELAKFIGQFPGYKKNIMLIEKIKQDQITARKNRDTIAATLLTTLLGEANMVAKNAQREIPTDEEVQAVIKKFLKGNAETQEVLRKSMATIAGLECLGYDPNPVKLAEAEAEAAILNHYLPKQLSEQELATILEDAIADGTQMNMGALMAFLKANYAGQYDGKLASQVIKANLHETK